jgi:hypothetical protein
LSFPDQPSPSIDFICPTWKHRLGGIFAIPRRLRWLCGALLLAGVMPGGLHADWDFSLISRWP